jgi:hypothetical protein
MDHSRIRGNRQGKGLFRNAARAGEIGPVRPRDRRALRVDDGLSALIDTASDDDFGVGNTLALYQAKESSCVTRT